jgi:heme/copper-type cytochrome/quinol oxidase subunit 2
MELWIIELFIMLVAFVVGFVAGAFSMAVFMLRQAARDVTRLD